ncbi:DUF4173 domain-containing protein [Lachnospiraceae bacterium 48-21]|jgi:hypothetical protein|nr:DUF4173 domain-containing protein [Dorea sp.]
MKENMLIMRMRDNYKYFGGLSLIYGLIFTFCLYKNISGVTFPVCVGATIVFAVLFMRKIEYRIMKNSIPYIAGMGLLGISSAFTTSTFMHIFNIVGILFLFMVFMIHQFYNDYLWNFPAYFQRILILLGTTVQSVPYPYWHGGWFFSKNKDIRKNNTFIAIVIGFVVAMGILCVTLPLLLSSDIMFSKLFGEILDYINFATLFWVSLTFIIGFTLPYAFFTALCRYNFPEGKERKMKFFDPVIGITFTSIVSLIYLVYCAIQVMYLFMGMSAGLPEYVTYAEYARGGFWELLFVSIINFIIILLCMYLFRENAALKIILTIMCGCTFVMIISSAYRMKMYIGEYNLTFLRILVLWFLIVLALIMIGMVVSIYKKKFPLFHYIIAVVSVLYIGFSFARPDVIIAKYDIEQWKNTDSQDFFYLMYETMSIDAAPEIAKIDLDDKKWSKVQNEYLKQSMYNYFLYISQDNEDIYFRKANYSRIRAKMAADRFLEEHKDYNRDNHRM